MIRNSAPLRSWKRLAFRLGNAYESSYASNFQPTAANIWPEYVLHISFRNERLISFFPYMFCFELNRLQMIAYVVVRSSALSNVKQITTLYRHMKVYCYSLMDYWWVLLRTSDARQRQLCDCTNSATWTRILSLWPNPTLAPNHPSQSETIWFDRVCSCRW